MPKLTTYTRKVNPTGGQNIRRATTADFGGGMGVEGTAQLSKAAAGAVDFFANRQNKRDALEVEKALVEAKTSFHKVETDLKLGADEGAPDHAKTVSEQFGTMSQSLNDRFEGVSKENKQRLSLGLARLQSSFMSNAVTFEAVQSAKKVYSDTYNSLSELRNLTRSNPKSYEDNLKQGESVIEAAAMNGAQADKLREGFTSEITTSFFQGRIEKAENETDISVIRNDLENFAGDIVPNDYSRIVSDLNRANDQIKARNELFFKDDIKDQIFERGRGVFNEDGYTVEDIYANVSDPVEAQRIAKAWTQSGEIGAIASAITLMTPEEISQSRQKLESDFQTPGEGRHDAEKINAFNAALENRNKKIMDDSVSYVMQNVPSVNRSYEEMRNAQESGGDVVAARESYVDEVKGAQERLGVEPRLLSNNHVQSIASDIASVSVEEEGAADLVDRFNAEKTYWGKDWPIVYKQLVDQKAISAGHVVLARISGDPAKNVASLNLAQALKIPEKEMFAGTPDADVAKKDLRDSVNKHADGFFETLAWQGASKTRQTYGDAIYKLAGYYMTTGGRMDADQAAQKAFEELAGADYTFNGSYRVPAERNADRVGRGVFVARKKIIDLDLAPAISVTLGGGQMDKVQQATSVAANGSFVTSPNEDGVLLIGEDRSGVKLKDGSIAFFSWEELETLALEDPAGASARRSRRR